MKCGVVYAATTNEKNDGRTEIYAFAVCKCDAKCVLQKSAIRMQHSILPSCKFQSTLQISSFLFPESAKNEKMAKFSDKIAAFSATCLNCLHFVEASRLNFFHKCHIVYACVPVCVCLLSPRKKAKKIHASHFI